MLLNFKEQQRVLAKITDNKYGKIGWVKMYFCRVLLAMAAANPFGLSLQQLRELMTDRGMEGVQKV